MRNRLRSQLKDRQFRHAYADEHLNLSIGTQIKSIREMQGMSQAALAEKIGTKQTGISRIESANYSGWSIAILRKLAEAFDLRLRVSFEGFGTLWKEVDDFNRASLERRKFDDDPEFKDADTETPTAATVQIGATHFIGTVGEGPFMPTFQSILGKEYRTDPEVSPQVEEEILNMYKKPPMSLDNFQEKRIANG